MPFGDELVTCWDEPEVRTQKCNSLKEFHTHIAGRGETKQTPTHLERCMKNAELTRIIAGRAAAALLALAACTGALSSASAATTGSDVPSATVRYADLDLSTDAGAKTLYHRIAFVAKQVCPADDTRDLSRLTIARACQQAAIERAVRSINSPHLAAAHAAATRRG